MKAFWCLVLLLGLAQAQVAEAQTTRIGRSGLVTSGGQPLESRRFRLCLVPDTQNVVGQISSQHTDTDPTAYVANCKTDSADGGCTGAYCNQSPYCHVSWRETGRIMLRNLAYELTGQWNLVDWSKIKGPTSIVSTSTTPLNHGGCDAIVSLGDMEGIPSGTDGDPNNATIESYTYAQLQSSNYSYQVDGITQFWDIIRRSGIPYLPLQGNHDNWITFKARMVELGIESESWFYEKEALYELSNAILVPMWNDMSLCIVGLSWADSNFDDTRQGESVTWMTSVTGCGNNYPTFVSTHNEVLEDGTIISVGASPVLETILGVNGAAGTAGMADIFGVAGGHYITSDTSTKSSVTGLFGADPSADVLTWFTNWQQEQRHSAAAPYGSTPSDSNGAFYTIIDILPDRDLICSYDWSPYWQTTNGSTAKGQTAGIITTNACVAFDFDVRFP